MDSSVGIRLAVDDRAAKQILAGFSDEGDAQAKRLAKSYERATDDIVAADRRRAQAAQKIDALMPQTGTQSAYQAGASTNYGGGSARDSAAAMKELLDRQDDLAARTAALKAKLDPLTEAQRRYDAEIKNADELLAEHRISEADHEQTITASTRALNAAKKELGEHSSALGFNRTQSMIATSAGMRFGDMLLAGQSPIRAFALESHKLGEVLAFDDGGVAGGLSKVRALLTPTAVGVAAVSAVVLAGVLAWADYAGAVAKLEALGKGSGGKLGVTGQDLEDNAEAASRASNITVAAAREIETTYVQTGKIGKEVLGGLTAVTNDFAAATGQSVDQAKAALAAAFNDPAKGAEELTEKYGLLDAKTLDYIQTLVEEGRVTEAQQVLLRAFPGAFDKAAEHASLFGDVLGHIEARASEAFTAVGRLINSVVTGGNLAALQAHRARLLRDSYGLADTSEVDRQIAAAQAAAKAADDKLARSRAVAGQRVVDSYTGADQLSDLRTKRTAVSAVLASGAGASADQIRSATEARAAYTHAIETWLPTAEKAAAVDRAQAAAAAAKTPAEKAAAARLLVTAQAHGEVATAATIAARANDRASAASDRGSHAGAAHAATLARQAESMEVAARGALDVADGYLKSSEAGVLAEARTKAATDATRKGIDVDAQAARQLALAAAQRIAAAAKSAAGMTDEADAREAVVQQVADGLVAAQDMDAALLKETTLRPLIADRTRAQGRELETLNRTIDATTAALEKSSAAAVAFALPKMLRDSRDRAIELRAQIDDLNHSPLDRALNAAGRAGNIEADNAKLKPGDPRRVEFVDAKVDEARAGQDLARAKFMADSTDSARDALEVAQQQIALAGTSEAYQARELDRLKLMQRIRRDYPELTKEQIAFQIRLTDEVDASNQKAKLLQDSWGEIRSAGDQFLSDLTNPDGSGLKSLLRDVEQEFIKLAALNPLKNMLLGEKNPTLGSIFGLLSGANKAADGLTNYAAGIGATAGSTLTPRFAAGTEYFSGGQAWVGENGPELVSMPVGSKVTSAPASRLMIANDNAGGDTHYHYDMRGAVLYEDLMDRIEQRSQLAAAQGAQGGAQLAQARSTKSAQRRMSRR